MYSSNKHIESYSNKHTELSSFYLFPSLLLYIFICNIWNIELKFSTFWKLQKVAQYSIKIDKSICIWNAYF